MNKLFEDKMDERKWQDGLEMKHDVMPSWWWNHKMRKEAYKNYLEGKAYE